MAYETGNYNLKITLVAGADLSAKQYNFVKLNSSGQAIAIAAATDLPIGILQNNPVSGGAAEVLVAGGSKLVLGGTVASGAILSPKADGTGVTVTNGTDTTKYVVGQTLVGGASGEYATVIINCANAGRAA